MTEAVLKLAREQVRKLKPYTSARSLVKEAAIFLDANESPYGIEDLNRYPDPQPALLREKLAQMYQVPQDSLFLGRGTDEAIDCLVRTFCEARRDAVVICPPTYGVYSFAAELQGASLVNIPLNIEDLFSLPVKDIIAQWKPNIKLIFLCSPNNPTGNCIPPEQIEFLCTHLSGKAVVVLDEAYIEFASRPSLTEKVFRFPNLVVLRTLSKAWALAAARIGVAISQPALISLLQKVRAPYPLPLPSVRTALTVLTEGEQKKMQERVRRVRESRTQLASELVGLPIVDKVFPSEANFLLVRFRNSRSVFESLSQNRIITRDRNQEFGLQNCLRITVGTPEENGKLLSIVKGVT